MTTYNIYCDESCHLENDGFPIMALGAVWCHKEELANLSKEISEMKVRHNAKGELKWVKVSPKNIDFYLELIDWFFERENLFFRTLVVMNKNLLDHDSFNMRSHDNFYYKMYYLLLNHLLDKENIFNIYLDIKDTWGAKKIKLLKAYLLNTYCDFEQKMIPIMQNIRSHESHLMQLSDFFIGAMTYKYRELTSSKAKQKVIEHLESKLQGYEPLLRTTVRSEKKFNIFLFEPQPSLTNSV